MTTLAWLKSCIQHTGGSGGDNRGLIEWKTDIKLVALFIRTIQRMVKDAYMELRPGGWAPGCSQYCLYKVRMSRKMLPFFTTLLAVVYSYKINV